MADATPTEAAEVEMLLALARYPRVTVKISHTWSISREGTRRDTWGLVKEVYQTFGAQRIMFSTDWPVSAATDYGRTIRVVREMDFWRPVTWNG